MKVNMCKLYVCWGLIICFILNGDVRVKKKNNFIPSTFTIKKENCHFHKSYTPKFNKISIIPSVKQNKSNAKVYKKFWQIIKILCICPMQYEYQGVLKELENYKCSEKQTAAFHLDELRKHLSLHSDEIEFFKINNNIICLILGGKRQNAISFKLGQFISTLNTSLELVIIGGICGCSDTSIKIGTVMIPSHFFCLDSLAIYNILSDGQIQKRKEKTSISTYNEYSLNLENIQLKEYVKNKNNIMKLLNAHDCINFTSSCFIDNEKFCIQLVKNIKNEAFLKKPHIFEMEDYAVAQACITKQIPFICLRVVSDHAGQNPMFSNQEIVQNLTYSTNTIDETKHIVSMQLGKTIKKLLKNLKIPSGHSHG